MTIDCLNITSTLCFVQRNGNLNIKYLPGVSFELNSVFTLSYDQTDFGGTISLIDTGGSWSSLTTSVAGGVMTWDKTAMDSSTTVEFGLFADISRMIDE